MLGDLCIDLAGEIPFCDISLDGSWSPRSWWFFLISEFNVLSSEDHLFLVFFIFFFFFSSHAAYDDILWAYYEPESIIIL